jgi:hypothetical protein
MRVALALLIIVAAVIAVGVFLLRRAHGEVALVGPPTEREIQDARQFALLLASQIKMYNAQQVEQGQVHQDLCQRLSREIDSARAMYEKKVRREVNAEHDYLQDALIDILANGDATVLAGYEKKISSADLWGSKKAKPAQDNQFE